MSWVVDTCLLIDVLEDDPVFFTPSATLLEKMKQDGLVLCPVSYVELAPAFMGDGHRQCDFLDAIGIDYACAWTWEDTQRAHKAWHRHVHLRRQHAMIKRPIADILIGAFAQGHQGLLTRNAGDFRTVFPALCVKTP
jgi:predicted nucleic acid-binding protein